MAYFKCAIILVALAVAFLFYNVDIHSQMEERSFVQRRVAPIRKLMSITRSISKWMGLKDIYGGMRYIVHQLVSLSRPHSFPDVEITEIAISGVRVKMYAPKASHAKINTHRRSLIYFHGGGYAVGNPEAYHYILGHLCQETGMPVFVVDYRKAPQHVYPAALDDCFHVTEFIQSNCQKKWNLDPERIHLAGDSAGGHLVAVVTLKLHQRQLKRPERIILIYPVLQVVSFGTPSFVEHRNDFVLSLEGVTSFWLSYFKGHINSTYEQILMENRHSSFETRNDYATKFNLPELVYNDNQEPAKDPIIIDQEIIDEFSIMHQLTDISPLFADDLSHFPETLIVSSKFDILREESVMMERRLQQAKVKVTHVMYNAYHGMLNAAPYYGPANRTLDTMVQFLTRK